jgi:hypothetical protein
VTYAEVLDEFLATMERDHADVVLIAATNALEYACPSANWNAHMGQAFAFVGPDGIPEATRRMLHSGAGLTMQGSSATA